MKIGIIGLGLIGGSILKSIKKRTNHSCYAYNRTQAVLEKAQLFLDGILDEQNINKMDVVFVCLTPCIAIDWIINNASNLKKGCIIADICGIKEYIVNKLESFLNKRNIHFVGCHPMAGKEVSGFINSTEDLFQGASFIITPTLTSNKNAIDTIALLALDMGFATITKASPKEHDEVIAYTSQLAHIVSNAYTKSLMLNKHKGFSAGSFQDLTRVAKLDSKMWTELFLLNKEPLLNELDNLINNLNNYKQAIKDMDKGKLFYLLEEGNQLKIKSEDKN